MTSSFRQIARRVADSHIEKLNESCAEQSLTIDEAYHLLKSDIESLPRKILMEICYVDAFISVTTWSVGQEES